MRRVALFAVVLVGSLPAGALPIREVTDLNPTGQLTLTGDGRIAAALGYTVVIEDHDGELVLVFGEQRDIAVPLVLPTGVTIRQRHLEKISLEASDDGAVLLWLHVRWWRR